MTPPQPDTETLVATLRESIEVLAFGASSEAATLDDDGRTYDTLREVAQDGTTALDALAARVATLEAALRNVTQAYPHPHHFQAARKLLDPGPSQPAQAAPEGEEPQADGEIGHEDET